MTCGMFNFGMVNLVDSSPQSPSTFGHEEFIALSRSVSHVETSMALTGVGCRRKKNGLDNSMCTAGDARDPDLA